jgi:Predicted transcriptional regulators
MTIAEKIKTLRKQAKLTQTELGEMLGVQKNAVSKWECGRVTDIPAGKIKAMAQIFQVPPSYLIDDEVKNTPVAVPQGSIRDEDIKFALFGGEQDVTDEMYEEVKQFAAFVRARNKKL